MLNNLQTYAEKLITQHNIPAISLAIWRNGELSEGAAGVLNLNTGVEANTDSIFQIGSITKVFTTSLVMKLVDDGRIDLDNPVKYYLRDFQLADPRAASGITVKQLLNHSSGIAGDYFPDDVNEDGPHIARLVDRCSQLPLMHPVGDGFSYSNSAFAIAGRLIEVMSGMTWADAMEEWIFQPLGMSHAICRPADVLSFRAALGHVPDSEDPGLMKACSGKHLSMGMAPAGTTPTMTARDVVAFARAHMEGGVSHSGERWLSEDSVKLMQKPTVDIPRTSKAVSTKMGLGWMLDTFQVGQLSCIQHGGATNGQCSMLRIFPEQNACFVILLNSRKPGVLPAISNEISELITEVDLKLENANPVIKLSQDELLPYLGSYRCHGGDYEVELGENGLVGVYKDAVDEEDQLVVTLYPLGDDCFEFKDEQSISLGVVRFMKPDDQGRYTRLMAFMRMHLRVG